MNIVKQQDSEIRDGITKIEGLQIGLTTRREGLRVRVYRGSVSQTKWLEPRQFTGFVRWLTRKASPMEIAFIKAGGNIPRR